MKQTLATILIVIAILWGIVCVMLILSTGEVGFFLAAISFTFITLYPLYMLICKLQGKRSGAWRRLGISSTKL